MHTTHDLGAGEPDETSPSRVAAVARTVGGLVVRIFTFAVVAAAGGAGWFGVEHYVFPDIPGSVAVAVDDGPWPDRFARPTTAWQSFTTGRPRSTVSKPAARRSTPPRSSCARPTTTNRVQS